MRSFARRRSFHAFALILLCVAAVLAGLKYSGVVPRFSYVSGWVLLAVILFLAAYNARKKLPFLPLGTSESWLQFHIYAGLFTAVLFAIHVRFKMPTGWFEGTLAWLYALVMVSGFAGLFLSRAVPKVLTTFGGEVLFERIPAIRSALQRQAEVLALTSVPQVQSTTIAEFYVRDLKDFFEGPRNFWLHLFQIRRPLSTLLNRITDLNRYLNERERATLDQIATLVRQKDGLDYHYALQLVLKGWLFTHIPLTYSLLLFAVVHIVLVFAFSGGAP